MTDKLQRIFREVLDQGDLVLHRELVAKDVPNWSSLAHIELVVAIEKAFRIRFTTSEIVGLKNVGQMMDLIERKAGVAN